MSPTRHFTIDGARELARAAVRGAGGNEAMAASLADATVAAEAWGQSAVGFAHLPDYLDSLAAGRIVGRAEPVITSPAPALIAADAQGGIAQLGFDRAFDDLCARATTYGIALFSQSGSYTAGELGYYVRRLADAGLVSYAAANGPALMASPGANRAIYCTNPFAFGAPVANSAPLVIDQASSSTAYVNIRAAAERGEDIPEGWAVDETGRPTTDPGEALKGALLTFGGSRGANVALMVEVLAAGLTGANWSLDAPGFVTGDKSPGAGLLVIAISPQLLGQELSPRLDSHFRRLEGLGTHIPGRTRKQREDEARLSGLKIPEELVRRIVAYAGTTQGSGKSPQS